MSGVKSIFNLEFPVFKMGQFEKIETNSLGLVKVTTYRNEYVVDDTNSKEPNYFRRRIKLREEGYNMYHLKIRADTVEELIKYKTGTHFIDKSGYIFRYTKGKKFFKLESHPIVKRAFDPDRGTILYLYDIPHPILYPHRIPAYIKFAGLLEIDGGHMLYNLTKQQFITTRRKI